MVEQNQDVEIQDPPIQVLNTKKSCLRRSCTTGCGCLVFFVAGTILFFLFITSPHTKEIKDVPPELSPIPMYDRANIDRITVTPGLYRVKIQKNFALSTEATAIPIRAFWNTYQETIKQSIPTSCKNACAKLIAYINDRLNLNVPANTDHIVLDWLELHTTPSFLEEYYAKEFKKNNIYFQSTTQSNDNFHVEFTTGTLSGTIDIGDQVHMTIDTQGLTF